MANWSTMKRSILIGSLSGPNFAIRTAIRWTAHELISPNSFYETMNKGKLFSIKKKQFSLCLADSLVKLFSSLKNAIKVTVNLQGCLPGNLSYARCFRRNLENYSIYHCKGNKMRNPIKALLLTDFVLLGARKPSNAKLTVFALLNYQLSRYRAIQINWTISLRR